MLVSARVSHFGFALSSVWSKQTVLNELLHSHNFWSFSSTSENQTIDEQETTTERKGDDANAKTRLAFYARSVSAIPTYPSDPDEEAEILAEMNQNQETEEEDYVLVAS